MNPLDLLVFGAHPDDVEISCGGLVHRMGARGYRVGICDLTRGEYGTRGDEAARAAEAEAARVILGAAVRLNLGLPDTALNRHDRAQLGAVVEVLRAHRPRLVVAPYWIDQHPDHEEASALVTRGCFLAGIKKFESRTAARHRPVTVLYSMFRRPFEARVIVDVSDSLEPKLEAVAAHRTQTWAPPGDPDTTRISQPGFLESLRARARFYGSRIGVAYGEAFTAREELGVDDPVQAFVGGRTDRLLG
ncbi:MAG TPA: bacillithiol biosynthesis deacetylase BshB1 [Candidatus Saccharimonadales bacterium]|nr:bacillithiol biosynthesis deacetylase BshB1 [Candidatus Saccharimonadales bacterium]